MKRGSEGEVIHEARVRRHIVLNLIMWLKENNLLYREIEIDNDALSILPEDGRYEGVIINSANENDVETTQANDEALNDSYGSMISTVPLPQNTGLERDAVEARLDELQLAAPVNRNSTLSNEESHLIS